ncbi:unnamed protein product, partial [Staurois parvus]
RVHFSRYLQPFNHRVPAGGYLLPVIEEHYRRRERTICKQYRSLPSAPAHCFVWLCIAQP